MRSTLRGPLAGDSLPLHGGKPGATGCNGCTDCCHLPEISVTDEEAVRLKRLHDGFGETLDPLTIVDDAAHEGWKLMAGPCVFRRLEATVEAGGCRIYEDRPTGCNIFTCAFLLNQRRALVGG